MRVGGLFALLLTGRLAFRLGGAVAAGVALLALVLVPGWWATLLGGQIEPTLLALALDRHAAGRPRQALVLGALVALGRQEAWPLLALCAAWVVREDRRLVPGAAAGWIGLDVLIAALGLPGETRFMLPAAGLLSVVAGVGAAALVRAAVMARRRVWPPRLHPVGAASPASSSVDWAPGRAGPPLPC